MKSLKSIVVGIAIFALGSIFAAEVKINDKVINVKNNTVTATYVFSTFDKTAPELNLTEKDFYQHVKHKHICGLRNPLVVKITAPSAIRYLNVFGSACNYADRRERVYVAEYSVDNKEWMEISKDKKAGGWASLKGEVKELMKNDGTVFVRFRKIVEDGDNNGLNGCVLFKKVNFTAKF